LASEWFGFVCSPSGSEKYSDALSSNILLNRLLKIRVIWLSIVYYTIFIVNLKKRKWMISSDLAVLLVDDVLIFGQLVF